MWKHFFIGLTIHTLELLGPSWAILEPSWAILDHLGSSWAILRGWGGGYSQNWAPMQVKLLFSKGLPKTQKTTKNNKTRKLSSHAGKTSCFMRKPRSWLTLGGCFLVQFSCFFVFFFVVFSSLRPERYFIIFYAILSLFSTPFLEFFGARWK